MIMMMKRKEKKLLRKFLLQEVAELLVHGDIFLCTITMIIGLKILKFGYWRGRDVLKFYTYTFGGVLNFFGFFRGSLKQIHFWGISQPLPSLIIKDFS